MMKPPFASVAISVAAKGLPFTERVLSRLPAGFPVRIVPEGEPPPKGRTTLFITVKEGAFLKPCPCTPGAVQCGYWVFSPVFMCPYRCSYCFLRFYAPDEPLTLYANLEDAEEEFRREVGGLTAPARIGTGEFADSLALDPWTGHAEWIAGLAGEFPNVWLELKTKSALAQPFLNTPNLPNLVAAWSLNPQELAETEERGAASVEERLKAARLVASMGRPVAFHFDPVIAADGWRAKYAKLVKRLFTEVDPAMVKWVSLGTLRFPRRFLDQWGHKLKGNPLFFDEFVLGEDGKLRYFWPLRKEIYAHLKNLVEEESGGRAKVYLCMESPAMWEAGLGLHTTSEEVERFLCG